MTASAAVQTGSLAAGYGAAGLFWGAFAAATPALQDLSGLGEGGFGLALGAMSVAALPVMQGLGHVIHRIPRHAIPLCLLIFAAGNLLLAFSDNFTAFIGALLILGGTSGALDISLNMRTARLEAETQSRLFNRVHALFPFAMLVSAGLTGLARSAGATPAAIFPVIGLFFLAAAALEWRAGGHQRPGPAPEDGSGLRLSRPVLILAAIAALAAFQEMSAQSWAAIFVERVLGAAPAMAGLAPSAFVLGLSAGRLAAHAVEHRLGAMDTVRIAACLAAPAFLILAAAPPVWLVLAASFVAGTGVGPVEPAVFRSVATSGAGGRALATVTGIAYVGYLLSPPVLGLVADVAGWGALWAATAALALCVAGLTLLGR